MRPRLTILVLCLLCLSAPAWGNPGYARALGQPCARCHDGPPHLNEHGRRFWQGDRAPFPAARPPLSLRLAGQLRWGRGEAYRTAGDPASGIGANADLDVHLPESVTLVSGLTLDSDGGPWDVYLRARLLQGEALQGVSVDEAWGRWRPGPWRLTLGRYAWAERLHAPSRRDTGQGYFAYRAARLDTPAAGLLGALHTGPARLALGIQNDDPPGRAALETPGLGRTTPLFDQDNGKRLALRLALEARGARLGLLALRDGDGRLTGVDAALDLGPMHAFAQWLWAWPREGGGPWQGGFYGLAYPPAPGHRAAVLINHLRPGRLADDPWGERLTARLVTIHYGIALRPGLRLYGEADVDFQPQGGGHANREDALSLGLDLSV